MSFLLILILGLGLPAQALTAVHESDSHWQFIVLSDGSAAVIGRREIYSLTDSVISIPTLMSENGGTKVYKVSYLMYYYINVGKIQMFYAPNMTEAVIPGMVGTIGDNFFQSCKKLKKVNIPGSVTKIGNSAFINCSALTTVTDCVAVKTVGKSAFNSCTSLRSIPLSNNVTSIGEYAFYNSGLTSFNVPNKVTTLTRGCFKDCKSLTSITIPTSVTTIEDDCFAGCSNINAVYAGSKSQWAKVSVGANNGALKVSFQVQETSGSSGGNAGTTTPKKDVCNCSGYGGTYVVKGTDGRLAINSGHGTAASGFVQLGTIPEGAKVTISKASGYYGRGKSSGHWGHVTYNGITGYCAMNYLEFVSKDVTAPSVGSLSYDNLTVSGFDVHASVSDDTGVSRVQCAVWTDANGQDDLPANWTTASACAASVSGGVATFHVSFSDHGLKKIIIYAWTPDNDAEGGGMSGMDQVAEYACTVSGTSDTGTVRVNTANLGGEIDTRFSVYAVAVDRCGNRSAKSATSTLRIAPACTKMTLPASLGAVKDSVFSGMASGYVVVDKKCKSIADNAFANCKNMKYIFIPSSVTSISETAFSGCSGFKILAPIGSYAQTYAQEHGIAWIHKDK